VEVITGTRHNHVLYPSFSINQHVSYVHKAQPASPRVLIYMQSLRHLNTRVNCFPKIVFFYYGYFIGLRLHLACCGYKCIVERSWECRACHSLWRLIACFAPRWPEFAAMSVHVGFVVDKVALGQVFPCQYRSTAAPYSLMSSGAWTMGPLQAQFRRDTVSPHRNIKIG
jgi:hypothetical protein